MRKSQVYDFCFLFNQMSVFFLKIACHAKMIPIVYTAIGDVAKLVDALDLGSSAARCESSSLSVPTIILEQGSWPCFFIVKNSS